jgi:putative transposase
MSWPLSTFQTRLAVVTALREPGATLSAVCRQFEVSRPSARKWRDRFRQSGLDGLSDASRRPHRCPHQLPPRWTDELLALRRKHPRWGAKKLHVLLRVNHPRTTHRPSLRSLERWLLQAGLTTPRPRRTPPGPPVPRPALTQAHAPNDVWTIDFKGWFRTGDGRRCEALTIRDLASRYVLCVHILAQPSDPLVRRTMAAVFTRFGLPSCLRVDNGSPFASRGPLNLSRLSVWWIRLGIRVDFTRRGKPQDNGAHEQMHRILKADTASPPAPTLAAQRRRFAAWQKQYNQLRPHEALHGQHPAQLYVPSLRPLRTPGLCLYRDSWGTRLVRPCGSIKWHGSLRFIGRAFVGQRLGFAPIDAQHSQVHLGPLHLGNLHHHEPGPMRPCHYDSHPSRRPKNPPETIS